MTITQCYCQVCVRPPLACSELTFCPFLPCFRFEYVYLYALCAYMYSSMLMCVFPLEWNILCCIYAIYCTFYRTYVLALQYLALYGIICLQLNSGYVKIALICPHTIPFWYFFSFLDKLSFPLTPCESPTGFFFLFATLYGKIQGT